MKKIPTVHDIELLAPAGNWECVKAAIANGANAVYFGIEKFNARTRATNFQIDELDEVMEYLHRFGVKGFVTLNILIFEDELEKAKEIVLACMEANVDAIIVQDLGLVKLIRDISPDFPIHGSTQMTITSAEAISFVESLGIERVVLGRENNLKQIALIAEKTALPLEVFVHGALCVSYSGQCLTSEVWGGRSANRGECAQACRLPYDLIVDGEEKPMEDVKYLLSPKDLATLDLVPELIKAGVTSFKIEGRLKQPEYVANVVSKYRKAIDTYFEGSFSPPNQEEMNELHQSFSRGFTSGFLKGTNNKQLVDGTFSKKRGVYLGEVLRIEGKGIVCHLQAPLQKGDGIVFERKEKEQGGRVYGIYANGIKLEEKASSGMDVQIICGRNDIDLSQIEIGSHIWKTSDPVLEKKLRHSYHQVKPRVKFPLAVKISGKAGEQLVVNWEDVSNGNTTQISSKNLLQKAVTSPLSTLSFQKQFEKLGDSLFILQTIKNECDADVILPISELNHMRREAVALLTHKRLKKKQYVLSHTSAKRIEIKTSFDHMPKLTVLCRTLEQLESAVRTSATTIYADFEFLKQLPQAVEIVKNANKKIGIATPRIHMPNEHRYHDYVLRLAPDEILVRNTGALQYYLENGSDVKPNLVGDFSLNISNHHTEQFFLEKGCTRLTPSYDLNISQMLDFLKVVDPNNIELVIHQHLPMYHTEHCVYCTFLSEGTDFTNCGRPCEDHKVSLKDRVGMEHPVRVDEGCRNTVYNAIEQSGAEYLENFKELGVHFYRIEFLEEDAEKVKEVVELYDNALKGKISGSSVWKTLKATNQLGVTRGQLTQA